MTFHFQIKDPRGLIFLDPERYLDLEAWHAAAQDIRRTEPVLYVECEGFEPFYVLTRHRDVHEVSRHNDLFLNTSRSVLVPDIQYQLMTAMGIPTPKSLVHLDGHEHIEHRKVTNDWFKPAAVKNRQQDIDEIADFFVDKMLQKGGECDFAADIAAPYTLRVIMSIFGVPEEDEGIMLSLTQGLFGAGDPEYMGDFSDPFAAVMNTLSSFEAYFADLAKDRKACPVNDLATVIANGTIDGEPMPSDSMLWYFIIVATAGHDTTSYALAGGLQAMLESPDQWELLKADPSLVAAAAEESIRVTSPVRHFMRYPAEDVELGGIDIKAGERVMLSYLSANHDEEVFDHPQRFDLLRNDLDSLISFGLGRHYCLGSQFARREIKTFLAKLIERVEKIELSSQPIQASSMFVGGTKHLPVKFSTV